LKLVASLSFEMAPLVPALLSSITFIYSMPLSNHLVVPLWSIIEAVRVLCPRIEPTELRWPFGSGNLCHFSRVIELSLC